MTVLLDNNSLYRVTPGGQVSVLADLEKGSWPRQVTTTPDGALIFTEWGKHRVQKIEPGTNAPLEQWNLMDMLFVFD